MRPMMPYKAPSPAVPTNETPDEIKGWLGKRGWSYSGDDPNTGDELWHNTNRTGYFTWAEAVAYEFYRFINLGANNPT